MSELAVALCQLNPTVGALDANARAIVEAIGAAEEAGADIAVFGELSVCGYPPEDLLLRRRFVDDCISEVETIADHVGDCAAIVGGPGWDEQGRLTNSAFVLRRGEIVHRYDKVELPTYAVFDEDRWFTPGRADQPLWELDGVPVGVSICEDGWIADGPLLAQAAAGARVLLNLNGSPYHLQKTLEREWMLSERARTVGLPIVYVNQVGGQDDLVFDGASMVVAADGTVTTLMPSFEEGLEVVTVPLDGRPVGGTLVEPLEPLAETWHALVLGTRDYLHKNGFREAVVGLSGGIDSSIVTALAVDALGAENVHVVMMPSRYSSDGSVTDAERLAANLGIDSRIIAIEDVHLAFEGVLAESFAGREPDLAEENLQSRIRGVLLMALSNKFGWMVLTTGNKSEMAVGYSTLYGDSAGGLAVVKDVYKTRVYELCRWRNSDAGREIIPESVLTKAPSAELRPDQRDDQSLPAYEILDPILEGYVEGDLTAAELIEAGHDPAVVGRVCALVDMAEYKRRQNPPGIRVTTKAFGRDRRLPMTNRYR